MMRSVSFVDRTELEFSGNHFSHSLCLGDVDGDGLNELVVGSVEGKLAVFRGHTETRPWRVGTDLGMITSVAIGDVLNQGKDLIVCVNTEGVCHMFDLHQRSDVSSDSKTESSLLLEQQSRSGTSIRPVHSQYLTLNVKTLLVASIDGEGSNDLFVAYTDRAVGVYRWDSDAGSLVAVTHRLPLSGQVGSLSVCACGVSGEGRQLLVAQAGGTYIPLVYTSTHAEETTGTEAPKLKSPGVKLTYRKGSMEGVVGVVQRRTPIVCTEVVGDITTSSPLSRLSSSSSSSEQPGAQGDSTVAICTLDGSIKLLRQESKQWELQVDHSLFSLHRLDITGSGSDEIVACAWDGMTYIVDQQRNVVKYHVGENVSAFCAGYYGVNGRNTPCLIYSTFHNQILVYHNVSLPSIPSTNLLLALRPEDLPEELKKTWESLSDMQRKSLIQSTLYGGLK